MTGLMSVTINDDIKGWGVTRIVGRQRAGKTLCGRKDQKIKPV